MFSTTANFSGETVALITGAASGIGAATAHALNAAGVRKLALVDRQRESLENLANDLSQTDVLCRVHDVADDAEWRATEASVRQHFGRLDCVVANAGIADSGAIVDMELQAWRRVLSVNLDGVFLTLRYSLPVMRSGARGGAIVIVSSVSAIKAEAGVAAYGASKAAVIQLARVAAKEHAADGIRVNVVLPGGVATQIWKGVPFFQDLVKQLGSEEAAIAAMGGEMPLKRYARAEEIAGHIVYLLSDTSGPMTGASVVVDSGYSL
jgi:NAD(P)-dependent dehydrogenase (short-subunit alcohol dehydrogenase family)